MEATVRELNQQTAQVLARAEAGEKVTITRNGRPVAVIRGYDADEAGGYPFRTDPMGYDGELPTFDGPVDFSERVDDYLTGFGSDD